MLAGMADAPRRPSMTGRLWGVALAGGDGRLPALARRVCGDERPKQYVPLLGDRTLLRQTIDRVALAIPPTRTAVVTLRSHAAYFAEGWAGSTPPRVLVQPLDRGTGAGVLLAVYWVSAQDPDATVAVFPSDHFVSDEVTFMAHVARIAAWVDAHSDRLVLLGARPSAAEVEYGWIELGRPLDSTNDQRMWEVRRFWEKPSDAQGSLVSRRRLSVEHLRRGGEGRYAPARGPGGHAGGQCALGPTPTASRDW